MRLDQYKVLKWEQRIHGLDDDEAVVFCNLCNVFRFHSFVLDYHVMLRYENMPLTVISPRSNLLIWAEDFEHRKGPEDVETRVIKSR